MTILNNSKHAYASHDYISSEKRNKIKSFLDISLKMGLGLGISVLTIGMIDASFQQSMAFSQDYKDYQAHLAAVAQQPLTFEGDTVNGCTTKFIESAHKNMTGQFEQDVYVKATCENGGTSIAKVKENINTSRMKMLDEVNIIKKNSL